MNSFEKTVEQLGLKQFFDHNGALKHDLRSIKANPWRYALACELGKAHKSATKDQAELELMRRNEPDRFAKGVVHTTEGAMHVAMGNVLETVERWHGHFRDIVWGKKTIKASRLATMRLTESDVPDLVIQHGMVKHNVGIGWIDQHRAELSDYARYPVVVGQ